MLVQSLPVIRYKGEEITELPKDLYIPPEALEVILEMFSGPLDFLLYLIRKNNLDILDIPMAEITQQYVHYIELMRVFQVELVAEYLEMAAILMQIKSKMLLPKTPEETVLEADPRAELVRRLQEYAQIKKAAEALNALPRFERDWYYAQAQSPDLQSTRRQPEVDFSELLEAFKTALARAELESSHAIAKEVLSVRERMSYIVSLLKDDSFMGLMDCVIAKEGRAGIIVTFLAILELIKEEMIELVQAEPFAPIYIRAALC